MFGIFTLKIYSAPWKLSLGSDIGINLEKMDQS